MYTKLFTFTEPQISGYRVDPQFDRMTKKLATLPDPDEPVCICLERIGDNGPCPVHGTTTTESTQS